jgi:PAS domain S-box-containing protein
MIRRKLKIKRDGSIKAMAGKLNEINTRDFIQFADDFLYTLDYRGYITLANRVVERLLQFEQDAVIGKHFSEFVREDWREKTVEFYREQFIHRVPNIFLEAPLVAKDGSTIWMELYTRTLIDESTGRITGYQTIGRDVTKRKHTEEKLTRKNDYLAALYDTTLAMMNRLDLPDLLQFITSRAAALMRTEHGFISIAEPGDAALRIFSGLGIFEKRIGALMKKGEGVSGMVMETGKPFITRDYQSLPGRPQGSDLDPIRFVAGIPLKSGERVTGVIGIARTDGDTPFDDDEIEFLQQYAQMASIALDNARDYSLSRQELQERLRIEEELRNSRSNLTDIINYLPDPTFVINNEGSVIAWNQALEDLTGIAKADIIGRGDHEYSIPFYGDRRPLLVDFALEQSENIEDNYSIMKVERDTLIAEIYTPFLREGGAYLWEKAKPLYDSSGAVVGAIETVRDLTERKQAEEALRNITQQVVRHQLALHELSKMTAPDFEGALRNILEIGARTLSSDRASIWFAENDFTELRCHLRFAPGGDGSGGGERIAADRGGAHLRALETARILAIPDAQADAGLTSLMGAYLAGGGVVSVMSVTVRLGGNVIGFVSLEQRSRREWSLEEQDFATSIADLIALSIESSERSKAEQALQEQKRFTENLIENSALATIVIDTNHRVMLWNKACEELTGRGAAGMIGTDQHWKAFYAERRPTLPDFMIDGNYHALPDYYANFSKSILTPDGWHAEGWYKNLGGRDRYILFESTPIRNNRGEIIAAVENIQDITALKLADEEMMRMRAYLKNIIDSMPSILLGVDRDGRITHWNQEAEKKTGIPESDARGRNLSEILPALEAQLENVRLAIEKREPQKVERIMDTVGGETMFFDVMVYPLIDNDMQGAVIRVDDVTGRVRIEEMMVQTEKMLSVGGLAAGMAHEINNPLGGILLGAQNILRRISPDLAVNINTARECGTSIESVLSYMEARKITKMIDGIREMGERASKIVSNMLSFSRQSESRMSMANIAEIIDRTLELAANDYDLKKKYDFRHIRVIKEYSPDVPDIYCVITEIQQVILNLLKNSAQAIAEKSFTGEKPTIMLRTRREGDMARIEIEDNGPGIGENDRKRVFEPFFTTKEVGVGTGLGLSVSYFIITNNHKGAMEVESRTGSGTLFIIHLPLSRRPL